ncbi:P-selectin glycoprotein ligand 1-like [Nilaparvata lugens]|uniref:P-selectin glycoprotein ligand 1-like n=1 Tax=Nilaparvata lugens TaxID=108931 RepID=UPI00193CF662|nr:P-selectin glycoprotein ligand 1-like [Nilaparvata lugens]
MSSFVNAPAADLTTAQATSSRPTTAQAVGISTQARTYAAVCGGGLTAPTYSQPAVMAAASWNPYSMWGPPPPWYTTAYPGLGQQQQQAPMQAPPPPSAELLAALAATTPIGAAEAATTPIGAAEAATTPIGAAEAATTPAEAATTPIGAAEAGPSQASSDDVKIIEESDETNFIEATPPTRELVKRSPSCKWTKVEKKKKKMSVKLFSSSESEGDSSAVPLLAATSSRPTTAQATSSRPTTAQGSRTTQGRGSASMTAPSNSCAPPPTSSSKLFNINRFNFVNETTRVSELLDNFEYRVVRARIDSTQESCGDKKYKPARQP